MRQLKDFLDHLRQLNFRPQTVVDVGVGYGTPELYTSFPDAYFFLFEPVAEFELYVKSIMSRVRGEYHLCALADKPGTSTLCVGEQADGGSLMHQGLDPADPRLRPIQVRTLDQLFLYRPVDEPVLLKTDCQGGDLNVVKGGKSFLSQCDVIVMEVLMFHFWGKKTPDFTDVVCYMREQGFVMYDIIGHLFRPFDGALGQVDIVFVKENGPFRAKHIW